MKNKIKRCDDEFSFLNSMVSCLQNNYYINDEDRMDLADYLFEMSNSNSRELKSRLTQLICHMLKLQYQPQRATRSWLNSIMNQAIEIDNLVRESPSLKLKIQNDLNNIYNNGLNLATTETHLDNSIFPKQCPWTLNELLDRNFILSYMKKYEQLITNPYYRK